MGKIGVYSKNPRFYYNAIKILKEWEIPFLSVDDTNNISNDMVVIISYIEDVKFSERQVFENSPLSAIRKSIPKLLGKERFRKVTIGIDPGPKPGIATIGDGVVIEAFELPEIEMLKCKVDEIISDYFCTNTVIRIGNGDRPNMEKILYLLDQQANLMEVVDERGTSMPHKTHNNALSAARIANIEEFKKNGPIIKNTKKHKIIDMEFKTIKNIL